MRVIRNIIALLASQIGSWAITFIITLVVPSYLGATRYGTYSFALSYVGFFALGMQLGIGTYLTWRIAREPEMGPRLTLNALLVQVPIGLVSMAVGLFVLPAIDNSPLTFSLTLLICVSTFLTTLISTCGAALAGYQIMKTPAIINLSIAIVGATLVLLLVHFNGTLFQLAEVGIGTQVVALVIFLYYANRRIGLRAPFDPTLWRTVVLGGLPFFAWSVVLTFYWQIDVTMLKIMDGDTVVGWYSAANRLISIPAFLPTAVVTAILPALSRERSSESPVFRQLASRSIRLVALVGIPAAAGIILLASSLFKLLHFGESYAPGVPLLIILSVNIPLVAIDMVMGTILMALGRQKAWTLVGLGACIINPIVNLWAIPLSQHMFGNGAIGAAVVTEMTEFLMFAGALYLRPKGVFTRWDVWFIVRCVLAAVVMVPAVWALSSLIGIVPAVMYGFVIYGLAAYALQIVTIKDANSLAQAISTKFGVSSLTQAQQMALTQLNRIRGRRPQIAVSVAGTQGFAGLTSPEMDLSNASTQLMAAVKPGPTWPPVSHSAEKRQTTGSNKASSFSSANASTPGYASEPDLDALRDAPLSGPQESLVSVVYGDEVEVDDDLRETVVLKAIRAPRPKTNSRPRAQVATKARNSGPSERTAASSGSRRRGR